VSSAQDRLLELLPAEKIKDMDKNQLQKLLRLLLRPASTAQCEPGVNSLLEPGPKMFWVWQTPLMLMSLSWVAFLVGYELCILTPCIQGKTWTVESTVNLFAYPLFITFAYLVAIEFNTSYNRWNPSGHQLLL